MEWPKRARTADWENGVLTLDGEKKFDIPELTTEIMERLAGYTLVGFHVKGYPVTDELLAPFAGHKSMVQLTALQGGQAASVDSGVPGQQQDAQLGHGGKNGETGIGRALFSTPKLTILLCPAKGASSSSVTGYPFTWNPTRV